MAPDTTIAELLALNPSSRCAIKDMFRYHSNDPFRITPGDKASGRGIAIVFGRADRLVAEAAVEVLQPIALWEDGTYYAVVTGGKGKDSGDLDEPEATFLHRIMVEELGADPNQVYTETRASNGGENCRFSLDLIEEQVLQSDYFVAVAHATSSRRLAEMLRTELIIRGMETPVLVHPTSYPFRPHNPVDAKEACLELLRLGDWPDEHNDDGTPWLRPASLRQDPPEFDSWVTLARQLKERYNWR